MYGVLQDIKINIIDFSFNIIISIMIYYPFAKINPAIKNFLSFFITNHYGESWSGLIHAPSFPWCKLSHFWSPVNRFLYDSCLDVCQISKSDFICVTLFCFKLILCGSHFDDLYTMWRYLINGWIAFIQLFCDTSSRWKGFIF